MKKEKLLPLVTPGEVLAEEFLAPLGITEYRLSKDIGVPPRRINEIVNGARAVSVDTAIRLDSPRLQRGANLSQLHSRGPSEVAEGNSGGLAGR